MAFFNRYTMHSVVYLITHNNIQIYIYIYNLISLKFACVCVCVGPVAQSV